MYKFISAVLASAGILLGIHTLSAKSGMDYAVEVANSSMVQINDNCSGTIINAKKGFILTAKHCTEGVESEPFRIEVNVFNEDGTLNKKIRHYASLLKKSETADIAILVVTGGITDTGEVRLSDTPVKQGNRVYAVGNPLAFEGFVSEGVVVKTLLNWKEYRPRIKDDNWNTVFSAQIAPGSSGGALLNEKGELVGVTVNIFVTEGIAGSPFPLFTTFNGATPLAEIKKLVEEVNG